eukprot:CAMPEP_0168740530 /NCGR_PEP_ID=MMETSP0724-20121128/12035_1 /TAXON_ID=265536 /ORGANISM="Amphiprora sp., Strain CCMP467" /LENGTH=206 /DNA_ID=CAMNT_0008787985 /DNA_START=133 /DNA_END=754 /DNA_ORIENTATION=+
MAIKGRKNNNAARAKKAASSAKKKAPAPGTRKSLRIKGAKPEFSPSELEKVNKDVRERSHLNNVMGVVFNSADDDDSVEETFPNWDARGARRQIPTTKHAASNATKCVRGPCRRMVGLDFSPLPVRNGRAKFAPAETTANTESAKVCEECSVPKGMWQCSACNTHNNTSTQECIDCGTRFGAESQGNTETSVSSSPTVGGFVFRVP